MKRKEWTSVALILCLGLLFAGCARVETRGEEEVGAKVTTYTVKRGDNLWKIAGYDFIYGDSTQWRRIYSANRDKLSSPEDLQVEMVLTIPR